MAQVIPTSPEPVSDLFTSWLARCVDDALLNNVATGLDVHVQFQAHGSRWGLLLSGQGVRAVGAPSERNDRITLTAAPDAWLRLLQSVEIAPGWQSFGAITRLNKEFEIAGDDLVIAQSLAALERIIELAHPQVHSLQAPPVHRDSRIAVGKTTSISLGGGDPEWIYWEESGRGTPVVMLHTAGADSRQYRYQLWDTELAREFHMFAFDMPGHGRSPLPQENLQGQPYELTLERYLDCCTAFLERVVGRRAIVVGCSMGAAMALVLAARRPDLLLGVVALEAPWRAPGRKSPMLAHPGVNAGLHNAAYVSALLSPYSPAAFRREAAWIYSQGGPGIYAGDLHFYSEEFDGQSVGEALGQTTLPIHLLTGDFDYSASPENSARIAALIKDCRFTIMKGLGHFPMIEHPDHFRTMFLPELVAVRQRAQSRQEDHDPPPTTSPA